MKKSELRKLIREEIKTVLLESIKIKDLSFEKHANSKGRVAAIEVPDELSFGVSNELKSKSDFEKWKKAFVKRWGTDIMFDLAFRNTPGRYKVTKGKKFLAYMDKDATNISKSYRKGKYSGD